MVNHFWQSVDAILEDVSVTKAIVLHRRIQGVRRERAHPVSLRQKQLNQPVLG